MANSAVLSALQSLRPPSGKRLPDSVITGMTQSLTRARYQLIQAIRNPAGPGTIIVPTNGSVSLQHATVARRKLMSIPVGDEAGFTRSLNTALLGGESYPILTAVLGAVAGVASAGAGLVFTAATTALDASRTVSRVLVRPGDELWQVEEIGKTRNGAAETVVHVGSYFLVDPYRHTAGVKGWLIHEERHVVNV